MHTDCFALLDDASTPGAGSRLYTGLAAVLRCTEGQQWPALLEGLQEALQRGQYAVSVCSYELGAHLLAMPPRAADPGAPPLAQVLVFDHCTQLSQDEVAQWLDARVDADAAPAGVAGIRANVDQAEFTRALHRIDDYIVAGDTYQVNYTYRLRFDAFGSPLALYARLRARQPVPYGALVMLPDGGALLSLSPELFVRHAQGELTARPMKGTAPAAPPEQMAENARRAIALANDPKNRAENLMIVDLLRNDIGRIAVTGSVKVPALFEVTRYSSVLQMTSTVQARLRDDATLTDIFQALYPCGSITGAPKRRTMEIIAELEPAPRGIYTGAIGWFDPPSSAQAVGNFCMSVPIRTLALQPAGPDGIRRGEMGVGAGIVLDSDPHEEFAECQLKARFLTGLSNDFELFETLHASRDHGCRQQERHLARLAASSAYFGFAWDANAARAALQAACAARPDDVPFRLRLALRQDGQLTTQSGALSALPGTVNVMLAPDTTTAGDLFLRHKSSVRARYDAAWRAAEAQGGFDMLFFNERGELTEGGRSNVFVQLDGRWHTPPLSCGLLPGVQRAAMLADPAWNAQETIITRAMLARAEAIVVCNALRGAMPAHIIASA
ncbi:MULTISPECIES: aminodeoxychorismate synthase component I [unclassified Janthinobacterium]|uniref:aminodeoxychorismate synthase component I n=1 Tax=unclassified Janthinobacterium TaxID=2610881 RepID=UPI001E341C0F|nr:MULTISPECIES: aminodeoxychorismate synthase component I [unclassified Janthinobacterium]MCC7643242.1 aminodeoxychorismate synthase component I [Janthinobacterium sp. EB271-G4-3-1]MCC7691689.1 aminodeoxychorismate synthase component I [Janthinobacterium sp. EB271-G4-3-2]